MQWWRLLLVGLALEINMRPTRVILPLLLLALCFALCPPVAAETAERKYRPLFNGKNLKGWIQHGGKAKYTIEGDTIVGTSVANTPNSFLCTTRDYSDFILEVELKVDDGLNSGIQIRSQIRDQPTSVKIKNDKGKLKDKKIPAGRVFGYQVEIDPDDRAFSGGIYDEGRRGWLYDLDGDEKADARRAFKRGEWNKYRIEAVGDTIKTWVNDVPVANLKDDLDSRGFIGLQVHSVGAEQVGKQVRWRSIRICEIEKTE